MMVMGDELHVHRLVNMINSKGQESYDHVVGIHCPERCETIADDSKERHQDIINDIDIVGVLVAAT